MKDEVNQQRVRREAEDFLKAYDGKYQAYALFDIVDAHSDNDDIVIVRPKSSWTVTPEVIESKCGWSPMEGHTFNWRVEQTFCNGHSVYHHGVVDRDYIGQPLAFR